MLPCFRHLSVVHLGNFPWEHTRFLILIQSLCAFGSVMVTSQTCFDERRGWNIDGANIQTDRGVFNGSLWRWRWLCIWRIQYLTRWPTESSKSAIIAHRSGLWKWLRYHFSNTYSWPGGSMDPLFGNWHHHSHSESDPRDVGNTWSPCKVGKYWHNLRTGEKNQKLMIVLGRFLWVLF